MTIAFVPRRSGTNLVFYDGLGLGLPPYGFTVEQYNFLAAAFAAIPAAVLAAAQAAPIHCHVRQVHDVTLAGAGTPSDPMRPA